MRSSINHTRTLHLLCINLVAVASFLNIAASQAFAWQKPEATKLAWALKADDAMTVLFEQNQTVVTRIEARDRTLENQLVLEVDWSVVDVAANGDATIEQTINRIRIKTGAPGGALKKVVDIDTSSDALLRGVSRDAMKQVKNLIGLKSVLVMSPTGEVVSFTMTEEANELIAKLPQTSAIRNAFSGSAMKKFIEDSSLALSDKSVTDGDVWKTDAQITMNANDGRNYVFDRGTSSTINSLDNEKANIDVTVTLTPTSAKPVGDAMTSPMELVSYSGRGSVVFDIQLGSIQSSSMTSELKTRVMYRQDQINTKVSTSNKMTVTRK